MMNISTIYSKEAVTIPKEAPLKSATHLMKDIFVRDVIVVEEQDSQGEMPVGILTDRDIVTKVIAQDKDVSLLKTKDVMNVNIITVNSHADIADCLKIMAEKNISRMPVINNEGIVMGMISISDILSHIQQLFDVIAKVIKSKKE